MALNLKRIGTAVATGGLSEAYNYYKDKATEGSRTAAAGAERAGQQFTDLANQQWDRSQQGQQRAQGYLDPAWNYAQGYANRGPGAFENAYGNLYAGLQGQGATGDAWNYVGNQLQQPGQTAGAYGSLEAYTNRPSAASEVYGSYRGPQSSSNYYNQQQGFFNQAGAGQGLSDQFTSQMRQPGTGEDWQQQNQGYYGQPTSSQRLYERNYGGFGEQGASEDLSRYDKHENILGAGYAEASGQRARLSGASATERGQGEIGAAYREGGDLSRGAQATERFAGTQLPGLEGEGIGEQFARTALQGGNPYLQMQEDESIKRLNQEMARRGHFDSGGANEAIGNLLAKSGAEKFKYMGDITSQGQQLGLQRAQAGTGIAQASDTGTLNRARGVSDMGTSIQGLTGQMEGERMGREGLQADILSNMMGMQQGDRDFDLRAAGQADQTRLARLQGMSDLAGQSDTMGLNRMNAGGDMAFRSQGMGLDRMNAAYGMGNAQDRYNLDRTMAGMDMAGMNDQMYLNDYGMRSNLANSTDQTGLARMMGLMSGAGMSDQYNLQRLGQYMQGAGQYDDETYRRIMGQGQLAGQMQGYERDRMLDQYNMLQGAGAAQAGNVRDFTALGMGAYGDAYGSGINAYNNAAGLRGMGQTNAFNQAVQIGSSAIGYGAGMGGGGGGYGYPSSNYYYDEEEERRRRMV